MGEGTDYQMPVPGGTTVVHFGTGEEVTGQTVTEEPRSMTVLKITDP